MADRASESSGLNGRVLVLASLAVGALAAIAPASSMLAAEIHAPGAAAKAVARAAAMPMDDPSVERYAVKRVQPTYPELAKKYRIEGIVTVEVTIAGNGTVSQAEFIRGPNVFRAVSLDAAKRWTFRTPGNGPLRGTIHFAFKAE